MGNLASLASLAHIKVTPDSDSIYRPGEKSVISEPITRDQYEDFDKFWEEVVAHAKTPIPIQEYPLVKSFEYKELDPHTSEIKVTLDGRWLNRLGKQEDEQDSMAAWYRVHADPEKRLIRSERLGPSGELERRICCVFHYDEEEESFRMEAWQESPDGARDASEQFGRFVEWSYLKPHLAIRSSGRKVECKALQPAPDDPGKRIVLSSDMSSFYEDPPALLDSIVAVMKQEALEAGGTVEYGEAEGDVVLESLVPLLPEAKISAIRYMSVNAETYEMTVKVHLKPEEFPEPVFFMTQLWKIYSDPVRLGYCCTRSGGESTHGNYYDTLEPSIKVNRLLAERDVLKEVESLDESNFFL